MNPKREVPFVPLLVGAICIGLIAGVWFATNPSTEPSESISTATSSATPGPRSSANVGAPTPSAESVPPPGDPRVVRKLYRSAEPPKTAAEMVARIESALEILRTGTEQEKKSALDKLEEDLWTMPNHEALVAIHEFLKTKQDATTGLGFDVGEKGILNESPTMRTFLLDQLGSLGLDSKDPLAKQVSLDILGNKTSADEWAIALRNSAWFDPNNRAFVGQKTREMLNYAPWQETPTIGFMEAFDGLLYAKDVGSVSSLAKWVNNEKLEQPSLVLMDRLAEASPTEVMNMLNANPSLFADRPLLRVDYYTAADLSNPSQRQAVEAFLNRPDVTRDERVKLLSGLVTPGSFASDNLFTDPGGAPSEARETIRMQNINKWGQEKLTSGQYPDLTSELKEMVDVTKPDQN